MMAELLTLDRSEAQLLPHSMEAEQAVLANILANNERYDDVAEFLRPEHFADADHARIYALIVEQIELGKPAKAASLAHRLESDDTDYVEELQEASSGVVRVQHFAEIVVDLHMRREAINKAGDLTTELHDTSTSPSARVPMEKLLQSFDDLLVGAALDSPKSLKDSTDGWLERVETAWNKGGPSGLLTGLNSLDGILGGLQPGNLVVLAGRPGQLKTGLAVDIGARVAKRGQRVLLFSLEMEAEEVAGRLVSSESRIPYARQRQGDLTREEMQQLVTAQRAIERLPFVVQERPGLTVSSLRSQARREKRRAGLALVIVDYLQLMVGGKAENRVQEVSALSRGLKVAAKDLGVPILALSQLSRAVEGREDKRPVLSDLRESGAIEQDADAVMFNYVEAKYLARQMPTRKANQSEETYDGAVNDWRRRLTNSQGKIEVIIAKNRHGRTATVPLGVDEATNRFWESGT